MDRYIGLDAHASRCGLAVVSASGKRMGSSGLKWSASEKLRWHESVGDATCADGTLDRLVNNAHRITLEGSSMRRAYDSNLPAVTPAPITE